MCYGAVAHIPLRYEGAPRWLPSLAATPRSTPSTVALRASVVGLTLATAAIHASLGGMLFMANAAGYTVLAIAMVIPGPVGEVAMADPPRADRLHRRDDRRLGRLRPALRARLSRQGDRGRAHRRPADRAVAVGRRSGRRLPAGARPGGRHGRAGPSRGTPGRQSARRTVGASVRAGLAALGQARHSVMVVPGTRR